MDPEAAIRQLNDHIAACEFHQAADVLEDLREWWTKGGFMPRRIEVSCKP